MLKMILILKITRALARQPVFALALALAACSGKPAKPDSGEPPLADGGVAVSRAQVVTAAAECAIASAEQFREAAAVLEAAAAQHATAGDATSLAAAREAFHVAFDAWQVNEALQFGPAAPSTTPGGNDLRDQIDSWPLQSRCAVEEQLVSQSYQHGVRSLLVNRRGLPTLEYLLFFEGTDTACDATSPIVLQGSWAALSAPELAARRRAYAAQAAKDVHAWAGELVAQWKNGFKDTMVTAGTGSALFGTTQAALNVVSDALFYADKQMKHAKLARPLGLEECAAPPCLDQLESLYAGRSKRNLGQNLVGMRRLLHGCAPDHSGVGFDDLLIGVGAEGTARRLDQHVASAQATLDAIDEPDLKEALLADPASVHAVHAALQQLTHALKTEFLSVLDLELPKALETDND